MEYKRRLHYFEKVKHFIDKDLIKVFTGQRRVGKSYLMYQVRDYLKETIPNVNIIYINKGSSKFERIKTSNDLIREVKKRTKRNKKNYLFIDEVQEIENFEKALRGLLYEKNMIYM